jgi:hypothetical protein
MSSADEIRDYSQSLARSRTNYGIVQAVLRKAVANGNGMAMRCIALRKKPKERVSRIQLERIANLHYGGSQPQCLVGRLVSQIVMRQNLQAC